MTSPVCILSIKIDIENKANVNDMRNQRLFNLSLMSMTYFFWPTLGHYFLYHKGCHLRYNFFCDSDGKSHVICNPN